MVDRCPVCENVIDESLECCPSCGFHLVGSTRQFEPIKIESKPLKHSNVDNTSNTSACILILSGITKGSKYELDANSDEIILGRNPKCTIFLNDMTVSRNHASIIFESGEWIIRDNGSYNGVWVNNKIVNTKVLQANDIIQLGNFSLEFIKQNS